MACARIEERRHGGRRVLHWHRPVQPDLRGDATGHAAPVRQQFRVLHHRCGGTRAWPARPHACAATTSAATGLRLQPSRARSDAATSSGQRTASTMRATDDPGAAAPARAAQAAQARVLEGHRARPRIAPQQRPRSPRARPGKPPGLHPARGISRTSCQWRPRPASSCSLISTASWFSQKPFRLLLLTAGIRREPSCGAQQVQHPRQRRRRCGACPGRGSRWKPAIGHADTGIAAAGFRLNSGRTSRSTWPVARRCGSGITRNMATSMRRSRYPRLRRRGRARRRW